ncbi:GNAT family N-acetyltransferase [Celeribacter neptunius]|uniref:Protein N-acetyltransferase, RimJ/RimL family n=1 Tax=Celeribacter neptunius TaxID=588602 RepID=A0A1I3J7X1_9RHOB|nr:GNAT family protein [Celeribacter neptunius]SFI56327.1 Protein N-acetyltransferase, RimJ/RimL family [Celeribacter neptunius]
MSGKTSWAGDRPVPVTLAGDHVRLEPLTQAHAERLKDAVGDLHQLWYTAVPAPEALEAEIDRRLGLQAAGSMVPFATCLPDGRPVGMTTYMRIDAANKRVEIGSTWISRDVQRGPLNTEAKYLLLRHAFEALDCIAVEFRTHRLNSQSRRAIERLGAQLDGILRSHQVMPNGTLRDTAVYSITAHEWPAVKAGLEGKLSQ